MSTYTVYAERVHDARRDLETAVRILMNALREADNAERLEQLEHFVSHSAPHLARIDKLQADYYGPDWLAEHAEADAEPLDRLDALTTLMEQAEHARADLVQRLRRQGASWTAIGRGLGVSKQAAQQRYAPRQHQQPDPDQLTF